MIFLGPDLYKYISEYVFVSQRLQRRRIRALKDSGLNYRHIPDGKGL